MPKSFNSVDEMLTDMGIPVLSDMNRIDGYVQELDELGTEIAKKFYIGHKGKIHTRFLKVSEQVIAEIRELQSQLAEANKKIREINTVNVFERTNDDE